MTTLRRAAICILAMPLLLVAAPYDQLESAYQPYLPLDDPAAFAMKIHAVSESPSALWGGGKDLFFAWCKDHCQDWFADPSRFVLCHADVHLGNIGTYPTSAGGDLGFGLIDFDDT